MPDVLAVGSQISSPRCINNWLLWYVLSCDTVRQNVKRRKLTSNTDWDIIYTIDTNAYGKKDMHSQP